MYGFWRLGVMPAPSAGATCVANGLATATRRNAKKTITAANTGTTQTTRLFAQPRLSRTAAAPNAVSTSSHRSRDPSWPPQNAETVYGVGSALLVVRATYENEKSCRTRAVRRTPAATSVETKAAISAFCAESARRRRDPARAWRPGQAGSSLVLGAYFDGHFVIIEPGSATKTPFRSRPSTTM